MMAPASTSTRSVRGPPPAAGAAPRRRRRRGAWAWAWAVGAQAGYAVASGCGPQLAIAERVLQQVVPPAPSPVTDANQAMPAPTPTPTSDANSTAAPPTLIELLRACAPGTPNSLGLGLACPGGGRGVCGTNAPLCTGDYVKNAPAMCTTFCEAASACGEGGKCVQDPNNALVFVCVPGRCIPDSVALPTPTPIRKCLPAGGNNYGIGLACATDFDCALGLNCTSTAVSSPLNFCSRRCTADTDCGTAAVCVQNPLSTAVQRGCLPTSCLP